LIEMVIGDKIVSPRSSPYIIAEVGVNHAGSLAKARELVELAHAGGADAVKFQTYKAESLASPHSPAYWDLSQEPTTSQYELFKKYDRLAEKNMNFWRSTAGPWASIFYPPPLTMSPWSFWRPLCRV
jgi:sialic acid synthase SpsE